MSYRRHFTRRDFVRLVAYSAALAGCRDDKDETGDGEDRAASPPPEAPAPRPRGQVLGPAAWRALEAASARILPSEPDFAGAREANVVRFIDRQLATPLLAPVAPAILAVARGLDQVARQQHRRDFAALDAARQDALLTSLAHGKLPLGGVPQGPLFRALHTLTLEGYLCDPVHGGNADMAGWQAIGFAAPALRSRGGSHGHH